MSLSVMLVIYNMAEFFVGFWKITGKDEKVSILVVCDSGGEWRHGKIQEGK